MNYRTIYLNPNYIKEPKTNSYCVRCQKDIKETSRFRMVHLVDGGLQVLHSADESNYVSDQGDLYFHKVGIECAKILGLEYTTV